MLFLWLLFDTKTILISTPPYRQTKQIDGYMSEQEIEEMRANHARDSVDFCNTCDAHIDLQGRDMLPRGMCIDCYITERREKLGVPNPIITDNWPENDPDEEPRCCEWCSDSIVSEKDERYIRGEMICKDCEESWHEQPRDSYRFTNHFKKPKCLIRLWLGMTECNCNQIVLRMN